MVDSNAQELPSGPQSVNTKRCVGSTDAALRRGLLSCSLKLPTLVAAVSPEQQGMKLMDQLARCLGQIAAVTPQLLPETRGGGLERRRTKGVAHLAQQHRQMGFKPRNKLQSTGSALNLGVGWPRLGSPPRWSAY